VPHYALRVIDAPADVVLVHGAYHGSWCWELLRPELESLVAAFHPVARLVFLAAFVPRPGVSANEQRRAESIDRRPPPSIAEWTDLGRNVWTIGPNTARELFFHDVAPDVAERAIDRLRAQAYDVFDEPSPLDRWPAVPASSVVCRDDRSVNPDWSRTAARSRLGAEPVDLDGGHSPYLTRPAEPAAVLSTLAQGRRP
jgi:hypothetical protein